MKKIISLRMAIISAVTIFQLLYICAKAETGVAGPPVIFWMPRDTYKNHFIAGYGFVPGKTKVWIQEAPVLRLMNDSERKEYEEKLLASLAAPLPLLPSLPPDNKLDGLAFRPIADDQRIAVVTPWTCQADALAFEHTTMWGSWGQKMPRIYWVETPAGISKPFIGSAIDPWFAFPDAARPGQWVRVIGRAMDIYVRSPRVAALKERNTGKVIRADWGLMILTNNDAGENSYHTFVKIPFECASGNYDLFLHKGGGGVYGWGEPVPLTILASDEPVTTPKTEVLAPEEKQATATWLNERLKQTASEGGGVVILPAGQYTLQETVTVPPGVVLRGVSTGGVELVAAGDGPGVLLQGEAALENLTISQTFNRAPAVQIGKNGERVTNVRLSGCRLIGKTGHANDPKRYCAVVVVSPSRNLTVRDCKLEGRCLVGIFGKAEYAHLAYCQSGLQVEAGLENSIVEFNECRDSACTYYLRLHDNDIRHNLFAWNKLVKLRSIDLPMGFVFNGAQAGGNAQVLRVESNKLLIGKSEADATVLAGKWLVVISGEARGTIRRIVSNSGTEIRLERAVLPKLKPGNEVYIGPLLYQNLMAANMDIRHPGGTEFLGACVDNSVLSHISEETHGVAFLGAKKTDGVASPCYFNMTDQLDVYYGGTVGAGAIRNSGFSSRILAYGNFFYNTTVNDSRWLPRALLNTWSAIPNEQLQGGGIWFIDRGVTSSTDSSALSANAVMESRSCSSSFGAGFYVGHSVNGTIFKDVTAYGNAIGLQDWGDATIRE